MKVILNERITDYFDRLNIKMAEVARVTKIPYSTLATLKQRPQNMPGLETLEKLIEYYPGITENNANAILNLESHWQGVPIYDTAVSAGMLSLIRDESHPEPSYYLPVPGFKDCAFGARVNGDSMYPEIRSGDFIICKEVTDFIFGDIYLVVTKDGQETVKRIFPNDNPDFINLVPSNREMPVTPILKNNIVKIYKVKGVIKGY